MVQFPLSLLELWNLLWEPTWSPGGKYHRIVGTSCDLVSLEFLTLRVVHTEPLALCQLKLRFSYPATGSWCCFCCGKLWASVLAYPSLKSWGQGFVLYFPFSYIFTESCWFFNLSSFLLGWSGNFQAPYMWNHNAYHFRCSSWEENYVQTLVCYIQILILLAISPKRSPELNDPWTLSYFPLIYNLNNLLSSKCLRRLVT